MPPIKNVLKDAWQTAKQSLPDKQRQQQYEEPSSEYGGSSQISTQSSHRPHNVHFADTVESGQQQPTEMNPLNPFASAGSNPFKSGGYGYDDQNGGYQCEDTGFNQGEYGGYQQGGFPPRYTQKFLSMKRLKSLAYQARQHGIFRK